MGTPAMNPARGHPSPSPPHPRWRSLGDTYDPQGHRIVGVSMEYEIPEWGETIIRAEKCGSATKFAIYNPGPLLSVIDRPLNLRGMDTFEGRGYLLDDEFIRVWVDIDSFEKVEGCIEYEIKVRVETNPEKAMPVGLFTVRDALKERIPEVLEVLKPIFCK